MKKTNFFTLLLVMLLANGAAVFAQSKIKDGTVTGTDNLPKPDALVEFESSNKGVLLPRVALTDITKALPLINHVNGMLVYNTATAGTAPNNVTPGFYYNNGTKWIQVADVTMQDLRLVGSSNHITQDAGTGGTGTSVGTGANNIAIGRSALYSNTTGSNNVVMGAGAFSSNTTGSLTTAIGSEVLKSNTTGTQNSAFGYNALENNTTGSFNSAFGMLALGRNSTGNGNIAFGSGASYSNTSASGNVSIGSNAGYLNKTGSGNTAVGYYTLNNNVAAQNTGIGYEALKSNTTGTQNVALGTSALLNNQMGSRNTALGYAAGLNLAATDNLLGNNTLLGANTGGGIVTGTNNTVLGANVTGLNAALNNNIIIADGAGNQRIRVLDNGNTGIGTTTPQKNLHVNGSLQVTNELNVGGNATTAGSAGTAGQYLTSNGPGAAPTWQYLAGITPASNGTVIVLNGILRVAQEMIVQMTADFSESGSTAFAIGNLDVEIIDNENTYTGTSSSNSFKVSEDGVYQVMMNMQLTSTANGKPVLGIWDDTADTWVARVNDNIAANVLQTYTLITTVNMKAANTYSFRIADSIGATTIMASSSGDTGSGPVSQVSIKRLR